MFLVLGWNLEFFRNVSLSKIQEILKSLSIESLSV